MNALQLAQSAYAPMHAPLRSARTIEYDAFVKVTGALQRATTPHEIAQAIYDNRNLWLLLATDVADSDNGLPDTLRARIFYLAEFTSLHSSKVLRGQATRDALVDVNSAIMAGLRQQRDA